MADHRNRDCMFCGQQLVPDPTREPVHLAFMQHLQQRRDCREQHAAWTKHMALDFKGD